MPLWLTKVPGLQAVRRASSRPRASRATQMASSLRSARLQASGRASQIRHQRASKIRIEKASSLRRASRRLQGASKIGRASRIQRASSLPQRVSRVPRLRRASAHRTRRGAARFERIIFREVCGESLSDVPGERAVEAQRRSQRGNALGQNPVQVRVGGARDVEVSRASVV